VKAKQLKMKIFSLFILCAGISVFPEISISGTDKSQLNISSGLALVSDFNPGEAILYWTAPGNNGYTGRAAGYDIRYQSYAKGPINTEIEWNNATRLIGEPSPSLAGGRDSIVASGLTYGASLYFCLKSYDSSGNYSVLSNSPLLIVGDTLICPFIPGNANADGSFNLLDAGFIVSFLYRNGSSPYPLAAADADLSGAINLLDVSYMISFLYRDGPPLICPAAK
jgi:hypothetical protein